MDPYWLQRGEQITKSLQLLAVGMLATGMNALSLESGDNHTLNLAQKSSRSRIRYHTHEHDKYDDTCGYDCINEKTEEALGLMLGAEEDQNDQCFDQAESLRSEMHRML